MTVLSHVHHQHDGGPSPGSRQEVAAGVRVHEGEELEARVVRDLRYEVLRGGEGDQWQDCPPHPPAATTGPRCARGAQPQHLAEDTPPERALLAADQDQHEDELAGRAGDWGEQGALLLDAISADREDADAFLCSRRRRRSLRGLCASAVHERTLDRLDETLA